MYSGSVRRIHTLKTSKVPEKRILSTVRKTIRTKTSIKPKKNVLIAISGGADSTALALVMHTLGYSVSLAHIHHGIRAKTADMDCQFVQRLAKSYRWPIFVGKFDVPALAKQKKESLEMAARRIRREFLEQTAIREKIDYIATGHNADDQAETILLNLFRGTGLHGMAGIPYEISLPSGIHIIRPFRDLFRTEICTFLKTRRQRWREDETNQEDFALRNRVRNEILPLIENRINPSVRAALLRFSEIASREDEILQQMAAQTLKKLCDRNGSWNLDIFQTLAPALQDRLVHDHLVSSGIDYAELSFHAVETLVREILCQKRKKVDISTLWKSKNENFHPMEKGNPPPQNEKVEVVIREGFGFTTNPEETWLSAAAVDGHPLRIRLWRRGDKMKVRGIGTRKISDILTDLKIPRTERGRFQVVECDGEVAALMGWRTAADFYVEGPLAHSLCIRFR